MKIPQTLPITAEQSRAARFQLGLTQANVIEESDLPGHKLKQFETGRFVPDMPFLEKLRDFYQGKGVQLVGGQDKPAALPSPASKAQGVAPASGMCFYVDPRWSDDEVEQLLGVMETNDERIASILKEPVNTGFFSAYDEAADALIRELFGLMALNYQTFRTLQGRKLSQPQATNSDIKTMADFFVGWVKNGPLAVLLQAQLPAPGTPAQSDNEDEGGEE